MSQKQAATLTELLHAKADRALTRYIGELLEPLFKDCQNLDAPAAVDLPQMPGKGCAETVTRPWIGQYYTAYRDVAFAYLQPVWRDRYLAEFIAKTESVAADLDQLRSEIPQ